MQVYNRISDFSHLCSLFGLYVVFVCMCACVSFPGGNACFASGWVDHLTNLTFNFINVTGLSMLETDGPYGMHMNKNSPPSH